MRTAAVAYRPSWSVAAAVLVTVSRGSLLVIGALLLFPDAWPGIGPRLGNPLYLLRAFASFCLAPGLAAWLLERAFAATVTVSDGTLVLARRGQRIEIPCEAIDRVVPWTIPLPSGGVWLRLRSGRRFAYGLQLADPVAFGEALADAGAPDRVRTLSQEPAANYARSTHRGTRRWYHPVLKFVLLALVPVLPLFRLHQWIAYGGTFGEYYMYGLKAYLSAFAIYWAMASVYLVLYAAALRAILEPVVFAAARVAPARTPGVRRVVETLHRLFYFLGVPLFLLRLFLLS